MASNTASYSFLLPTVGSDTNVWGGYLNQNWEDVDDLLDGTTPVNGIDINGGSIDGTPIGANSADTGEFAGLTINDTGDQTKQVTLDISNVTTGTSRNWAFPDAADTFVGVGATQTLTNKTLDAPAFSGAASGTLDLSSATLTLADNQISGNKVDGGVHSNFTAIDPTFNDGTDQTKQVTFDISNITTGTARNWAFPDAADTFVGLTAIQTLTNKTLSAPTFSGAASGTLDMSSVTLTLPNDSVDSDQIATGAVDFDHINSNDISTQAEAEAGTNSTSLMTPERTKQAIDALGGSGFANSSRVATTSGNATAQIQFAPTYMFKVMFEAVGVSAASDLGLQFYDQSGLHNTGYTSHSVGLTDNATFTGSVNIAQASASNCMVIKRDNVGTFTGSMTCTKVPGQQTWVCEHTGMLESDATVNGGGRVTIDSACDGIRIFRINTGNFNSGAISVLYI